eukprot:3168346-Pyramimonas_sp.AAC.1
MLARHTAPRRVLKRFQSSIEFTTYSAQRASFAESRSIPPYLGGCGGLLGFYAPRSHAYPAEAVQGGAAVKCGQVARLVRVLILGVLPGGGVLVVVSGLGGLRGGLGRG